MLVRLRVDDEVPSAAVAAIRVDDVAERGGRYVHVRANGADRIFVHASLSLVIAVRAILPPGP